MPTYQITTTERQEYVLVWLMDAENTRRALALDDEGVPLQPPVDKQGMLQVICEADLMNGGRNLDNAIHSDLEQAGASDTATQAVLVANRTALSASAGAYLQYLTDQLPESLTVSHH